MKRFCTGAMSYGSISKEAHETMAIALNVLQVSRAIPAKGARTTKRFVPLELPQERHESIAKLVEKYQLNGDTHKNVYSKRSSIEQVAGGRFGGDVVVSPRTPTRFRSRSRRGGQARRGELPGHKVDKTIAATRHSAPAWASISPPPHHDIYSIEDLSQLIFDLEELTNPSARVGVKLVSEVGVGRSRPASPRARRQDPDSPATPAERGASPLTSIKRAGLP